MHLINKSFPGELKIVTEIDETTENNRTIQRPAFTFKKSQHFTFLLKIKDPAFF